MLATSSIELRSGVCWRQYQPPADKHHTTYEVNNTILLFISLSLQQLLNFASQSLVVLKNNQEESSEVNKLDFHEYT